LQYHYIWSISNTFNFFRRLKGRLKSSNPPTTAATSVLLFGSESSTGTHTHFSPRANSIQKDSLLESVAIILTRRCRRLQEHKVSWIARWSNGLVHDTCMNGRGRNFGAILIWSWQGNPIYFDNYIYGGEKKPVTFNTPVHII
jgi:hypothetical protein